MCGAVSLGHVADMLHNCIQILFHSLSTWQGSLEGHMTRLMDIAEQTSPQYLPASTVLTTQCMWVSTVSFGSTMMTFCAVLCK